MATVYDFEAQSIDGQTVSLSAYQGKVMLIVNTASACGFTPQFAGLEKLHQEFASQGLVVLGYWDNGIRHMSNNKRPLLKPDDLKGLKMRTPPDTVTVDIMQSLGAEAQQIKFSELYVALQQGVVDGQENPLVNVQAGKLYEVQKYISLTGHKYELTPFLIGKRAWDRLSDADKRPTEQPDSDGGRARCL